MAGRGLIVGAWSPFVEGGQSLGCAARYSPLDKPCKTAAAMPKLHAFPAVRYVTESGDISSRIAPPYDVLDEGPKQALLAKDPHNIVAVDLPVTPPKTVGPDEAYDAAGRTWRQWLAEGVLQRDDQPTLFAYEQRYTVGGRELARRGLFAALGVEDFNRPNGGIFRHEHTIAGGTSDRLKLMNATAAQLSPVFGVFDDPQQRVAELLADTFEREPDFRGVTDHDNVTHLCWAVRDEATIRELAAFFAPTDVFIADGHHRYTTALNYAREHPDQPDAQTCLFVLVPTSDPGLIVLPTHRVLCDLADFDMAALLEALEQDERFAVRPTYHGGDATPHMLDELPDAGHHAFGLYEPKRGKTYIITTTEADPLAPLMPERDAVWRQLDVAVFHHLFVDEVVRPRFGGDAVSYKYPHELAELIRLTHDEPGRLGVIMQATPLESVCDVARAGEVMPPKSTFFFPKLATGLVINPLD